MNNDPNGVRLIEEGTSNMNSKDMAMSPREKATGEEVEAPRQKDTVGNDGTKATTERRTEGSSFAAANTDKLFKAPPTAAEAELPERKRTDKRFGEAELAPFEESVGIERNTEATTSVEVAANSNAVRDVETDIGQRVGAPARPKIAPVARKDRLVDATAILSTEKPELAPE